MNTSSIKTSGRAVTWGDVYAGLLPDPIGPPGDRKGEVASAYPDIHFEERRIDTSTEEMAEALVQVLRDINCQQYNFGIFLRGGFSEAHGATSTSADSGVPKE